jgi:hypothetical protein
MVLIVPIKLTMPEAGLFGLQKTATISEQTLTARILFKQHHKNLQWQS